MPAPAEKVLIVDFGSQYAQLIARRVREARVFSEIVPCTIRAAEVRERAPRGIILTGGPGSVYEEGAPALDPEVFRLGIPILGICYGLQYGAKVLGGEVKAAPEREYGRTRLTLDPDGPLFKGIPRETVVWMSHGDRVEDLPETFESIARTESCRFAAARHRTLPFYGVQFHPEVTHTERGADMLRNFLREVCGCEGTWGVASYVDEAVRAIRETVGPRDRVICGLSGGVDSSVVALLCHRAVGERLTCIFVDNGLLRRGEVEEVVTVFKGRYHVDFRLADARARFLAALEGVTDPEEKRRRIGHEFIAVFREAAASIEGARFLAQGTLYPDVIESVAAHGGPSATIKTHHNVGGLPKELGFELVEPLRLLFKDEVRRLGEELGLPREICWRHPFPGPGLAVRILGEVTWERLEVLRAADAIVIEELRGAGLYDKVWQAFAVLLPVSTVGVMGDQRTYANVVALRAVTSDDGMTADWARLPYDLLGAISSRIVNEVRGVNRVVYDCSSKPPSTIEWE